jgi:hypothetical protein
MEGKDVVKLLNMLQETHGNDVFEMDLRPSQMYNKKVILFLISALLKIINFKGCDQMKNSAWK